MSILNLILAFIIGFVFGRILRNIQELNRRENKEDKHVL